ncbi:hypothetical protein QTN25_005832 [Entamoeba marina]
MQKPPPCFEKKCTFELGASPFIPRSKLSIQTTENLIKLIPNNFPKEYIEDVMKLPPENQQKKLMEYIDQLADPSDENFSDDDYWETEAKLIPDIDDLASFGDYLQDMKSLVELQSSTNDLFFTSGIQHKNPPLSIEEATEMARKYNADVNKTIGININANHIMAVSQILEIPTYDHIKQFFQEHNTTSLKPEL